MFTRRERFCHLRGAPSITGPWQRTLIAGLGYKLGSGGQSTVFDVLADPCLVSPTSVVHTDNSFALTCTDTALDSDGDGVEDDLDNCSAIWNPGQEDADGDAVGDVCDLCEGDDLAGDSDSDGWCDDTDNCPSDANSGQADADADGTGDLCEGDSDSDGVIDDDDNCPADANADQADSEADGLGDVCDDDDDNDGHVDGADNCPLIPNADQADDDLDGAGNACDGDDDGVPDGTDLCPGTPMDVGLDGNGCGGLQLIELTCGAPADHPNHGSYVSCVAQAGRPWPMAC